MASRAVLSLRLISMTVYKPSASRAKMSTRPPAPADALSWYSVSSSVIPGSTNFSRAATASRRWCSRRLIHASSCNPIQHRRRAAHAPACDVSDARMHAASW